MEKRGQEVLTIIIAIIFDYIMVAGIAYTFISLSEQSKKLLR